MEENKLTRINKFLSEVGYCSRRAADKLIEQNRVTINGEVPLMGTKVAPNDIVHVDGKLISVPNRKNVYIAFNKPVGIVCTTDTGVEKDNIIDYINYPTRIFPIGRLDKPSEGLIFLTDKCKVRQINRFEFNIILTQGLNRQIRRMCDYFGYKVVELKRIRIMNIKLDVRVGQWRDLTQAELDEINGLTIDSTKVND